MSFLGLPASPLKTSCFWNFQTVQTVFLLEKMLLELSKAAKMAFGREVCQAKLHYSSASIRWPVWALDPSKGPYPSTVVSTQVLSCCLARLGPGPFKGPYPSSVLRLQALEYYFKGLWCEAGRGALEPGSRVPLRMEP